MYDNNTIGHQSTSTVSSDRNDWSRSLEMGKQMKMTKKLIEDGDGEMKPLFWQGGKIAVRIWL